MSSSSWAVGEALHEISSQKGSIEEALRQLALIEESLESQANQAIEDVQEAVAQQISRLKQREEQLLLQMEASRARERQRLQLKEGGLKDAIAILSSAIGKIKQIADGQVNSVDQKRLQWGLAGLFDAVNEIINSVDDIAQQVDLHCHLDGSKLQEAISLFGQVDLANPNEAQNANHETTSSVQLSIDAILTSCCAISGEHQQWLSDMEMSIGLSPVDAVLQGLKKQSELPTVWLVAQPNECCEKNSFAECIDFALKQIYEETGEWDHWLQSANLEASSSQSSIDSSLWVVPEDTGDITISERDDEAGIYQWPQATSAAESIMAALQRYFAAPLTDWFVTRDDEVPLDEEADRWLIEENSAAVFSALNDTLEQCHHSIWLSSSDDNGVFPQPDEYQLGCASTDYNHVASAFDTLSINAPDYYAWLAPSSVEAPATPIIAPQFSDNKHWLSCQESQQVSSNNPLSAQLLCFIKPSELSHQWHNINGKMKRLHIASQQSQVSESKNNVLVADWMANALKHLDEETADIRQWLAKPASCADQSLKTANELEYDSTENSRQQCCSNKPFLFQSQHLSSQNSHSLCDHNVSGQNEDIGLWLTAEHVGNSEDDEEDYNYEHGDIDDDSTTTASTTTATTTTNQDFEVIDQFMKSDHLSLDDDDDWLYQPEQ